MTNSISFESLQALLAHNLPVVHRLRFIDVACVLGAFYVVIKVAQVARRRLKTTDLQGPPSHSFVWGLSKDLLLSPDSGADYENWVKEYGGAYEVPLPLGGKRINLCDPRAVAHFFARDTWTYVLTPYGKLAAEYAAGKGLLSATGEHHRILRKALTPSFSNTAVRDLSSVFYDSAYKAKYAWDALIESNGGGSTVIEVENWMNHISLDTIGMAGFAHDFGALDGKRASVTELFDAFGNGGENLNMLLVMISQALPWLMKLPSPHAKTVKRLNSTMGEIADILLTKSRKEMEAGTWGDREENSIIGILIKTISQGGQLELTRDEVMGHAKFLLLAGYESTSISLTWSLIELATNPDIQTKLREELLQLGAEPTYDQLTNGLPYLDAVVHEVFRMHTPLSDFYRMAAEDDVIPLSEPVRTRSGKLVDHISVAKGTYLSVSIASLNRSTTLWGPDAKEFKPERWLTEDGVPAGAKEVQGHRHILTFLDGPKACLGKGFAIGEFKTVLAILVRHFVFELRDGPKTVIEMARGLLPRPKVVGEKGNTVPLRVRRFE